MRVPAAQVVVAAMTLMGAGCGTTVGCPQSIEQLHDPGLRARIGDNFVAGTATVNRYVDSPQAHARGYDLTITSRVAGLGEADQMMFAVAQTPMPTIELGDEVLVIGRRGPRVAEIRPAGCPVISPVGDH